MQEDLVPAAQLFFSRPEIVRYPVVANINVTPKNLRLPIEDFWLYQSRSIGVTLSCLLTLDVRCCFAQNLVSFRRGRDEMPLTAEPTMLEA